jgi:hypothetical protein
MVFYLTRGHARHVGDGEVLFCERRNRGLSPIVPYCSIVPCYFEAEPGSISFWLD